MLRVLCRISYQFDGLKQSLVLVYFVDAAKENVFGRISELNVTKCRFVCLTGRKRLEEVHVRCSDVALSTWSGLEKLLSHKPKELTVMLYPENRTGTRLKLDQNWPKSGLERD